MALRLLQINFLLFSEIGLTLTTYAGGTLRAVCVKKGDKKYSQRNKIMKVFALRLKPDEDLRQSLKSFAQEQGIKAGFILTAIGSLKQAKIRFADCDVSTVL